jgi:hypothetical protein
MKKRAGPSGADLFKLWIVQSFFLAAWSVCEFTGLLIMVDLRVDINRGILSWLTNAEIWDLELERPRRHGAIVGWRAHELKACPGRRSAQINAKRSQMVQPDKQRIEACELDHGEIISRLE